MSKTIAEELDALCPIDTAEDMYLHSKTITNIKVIMLNALTRYADRMDAETYRELQMEITTL